MGICGTFDHIRACMINMTLYGHFLKMVKLGSKISILHPYSFFSFFLFVLILIEKVTVLLFFLFARLSDHKSPYLIIHVLKHGQIGTYDQTKALFQLFRFQVFFFILQISIYGYSLFKIIIPLAFCFLLYLNSGLNV